MIKPEALKHRNISVDHPCFSDGKFGRQGRLHLPVSGACNIQCRFCLRALNATEQRPGVASGLIRPEDAVSITARALYLCPEITVIGIAGPGDALASSEAFETFSKIHSAYPELIKCLSTNGLALPGKSSALWDVGVRSITVTINAVDPYIGEKVVSRIISGGQILTGAGAAEILIENQLSGVSEASREGMLVKVNTVLIPGVNDHHVEDIAKAAAACGASKHNLIPLIPQHEMADMPAPTCEQIEAARSAAGKHLNQFRHCAHCRADACGVPGANDHSIELYGGVRVQETFSHS
ncbi:MAG: radical SAM protein [Clostridiales bacterium]|nr:radical SAM protein [Clostridiales bacterium]